MYRSKFGASTMLSRCAQQPSTNMAENMKFMENRDVQYMFGTCLKSVLSRREQGWNYKEASAERPPPTVADALLTPTGILLYLESLGFGAEYPDGSEVPGAVSGGMHFRIMLPAAPFPLPKLAASTTISYLSGFLTKDTAILP